VKIDANGYRTGRSTAFPCPSRFENALRRIGPVRRARPPEALLTACLLEPLLKRRTQADPLPPTEPVARCPLEISLDAVLAAAAIFREPACRRSRHGRADEDNPAVSRRNGNEDDAGLERGGRRGTIAQTRGRFVARTEAGPGLMKRWRIQHEHVPGQLRGRSQSQEQSPYGDLQPGNRAAGVRQKP